VGPQSDEVLEIVASTKLADDASGTAADKWEAVMQGQSGQDYVDNTSFNCDGKYDAQAASFFQDVRITSIAIGWNLPGPGTSCTGTQQEAAEAPRKKVRLGSCRAHLPGTTARAASHCGR